MLRDSGAAMATLGGAMTDWRIVFSLSIGGVASDGGAVRPAVE